MKSKCPVCGEIYSPNGGGHCMECHRTFASDAAGDAHRKGPYEPRSARYCVDFDADFNSKGRKVEWRLTARGWTNAPPMTEEQLARKIGATVTVDSE